MFPDPLTLLDRFVIVRGLISHEHPHSIPTETVEKGYSRRRSWVPVVKTQMHVNMPSWHIMSHNTFPANHRTQPLRIQTLGEARVLSSEGVMRAVARMHRLHAFSAPCVCLGVSHGIIPRYLQTTPNDAAVEHQCPNTHDDARHRAQVSPHHEACARSRASYMLPHHTLATYRWQTRPFVTPTPVLGTRASVHPNTPRVEVILSPSVTQLGISN